MKRVTILVKLCLWLFFINSFSIQAQQWNFYKPLTNLTIQKEIHTYVDGRAVLGGSGGFFTRSWGATEWTKINPSFIFEHDSDISWFSITRNLNALYYPTGQGMAMMANYTDNATTPFVSAEFFNTDNCGECLGNSAGAIISNGSTVLTVVNMFSFSNGSELRFIRSTNYGASFSDSTVFSGIGDSVETGDVIGTDSYIFASRQGRIYKSTDGGASFQTIANHPFGFKKIKKAFGNEIYAITHEIAFYPNVNSFAIQKSTDNGVTWSVVDTGLPIQKFNTLEFEGDLLYLAGDAGLYSKSSTTSNWVNETHNLTTSSFNSVSYVGGKLFCVTGDVGEFQNQVFSRDDVATANWTEFNQGIFTTYKDFNFITGNKIAVYDSYFNKFFSKDTAAGWDKKIVSGTAENQQIVGFVTDNTGTIYITKANTGVLKKSQDGGETFSTFTLTTLPIVSCEIKSVNDNGIVLCVIQDDGGSSLYAVNTNTNTISLIMTIDGSSAFLGNPIIDNLGTIYISVSSFSIGDFNTKTSDFGATFTNFSFPSEFTYPPHRMIDGIIIDTEGRQKYNPQTEAVESFNLPSGATLLIDAIRNLDTLYALKTDTSVSPENRKILKSIDGGTNWVEIDLPFNAGVGTLGVGRNYKIGVDLNSTLFLEYNDNTNPANNGFYYWTDTLALNNLDNNPKITVYPNPTKGVLNISGETPIKTISIYNIVGQQLLFNKVDAATTCQINMSSLPKGVYLVQIEGENAMQTTKIVKE